MDGSSLTRHSVRAAFETAFPANKSGTSRYASRPREVWRARVLDLIDEPECAPITLIVAPAGYGKTTVAHQWLARHPNVACGWYQIRSGHNTASAFLDGLWRAIDAASGAEDPPHEIAIGHVLERLQRQPKPIVLVLDDYHSIEDERVHQLVGALLRQLPATVRLMLLSRHIPALPLARLRAYGQVRQITQKDLAFTDDEVRQIFAGVRVGDESLLRLTERLEGWIAGLQLTLMSVNLDSDRASEQLDRLIPAMSSNGLLNDYVVEEVLDALPDVLRRFVLDTACLDRLDPGLCNAVLDINNSDLLLDQLAANIVFVTRVADESTQLTYHQLFAECVQRLRLRRYPNERTAAELKVRAARWHEERGELEEAAEYALAAEAWDEAKDLIQQFLPESLPHTTVWKALYWLRRLPMSVLRLDTRLFQTFIHTLLANGLSQEARSLIEIMAQGEDSELTPHQQGWLACQLAVIASEDGNRPETLRQSYRALSLLPPDDTIVRMLAWSYIYQEETSRGDRALGKLVLQQAAINRARHQRPSVCWHFVIEPMIANDSAIRGDLLGAEQLVHHFIANIPAEIGTFSGKFRLRLLVIYLEQNRLDRANAEAERILEEMRQRLHGSWFPEALIAIANCKLAIGHTESARELLDRALRLSKEQGGPRHIAMAEAAKANFWLRTGQNHLAHFWAATTALSPYLAREFGEIEPRAVRLRLLLLENKTTDARTLVDESLSQARSSGHVAAEIELLTWSSVIARASGDSAKADDDLRQALELGAPGRFVRIYSSTGVDQCESIRALLPTLTNEARAHARFLIGESQNSLSCIEEAQWADIGLTQREREVLAALLLGKSNREIASMLFISERTVKKHLASLFEKTGESNRTSLALWARDHMSDAGDKYQPPVESHRVPRSGRAKPNSPASGRQYRLAASTLERTNARALVKKP